MLASSGSINDFERHLRSYQDTSRVWHSWHLSMDDLDSRDSKYSNGVGDMR